MASRKCVIVERTPSSSSEKETDYQIGTDWTKCLICQTTIENESLQYPAKSKRSDVGAGYKTIAEDLQQLSSFETLPFLHRIDDGSGIEQTIQKNMACWHSKCRLQYSKTRIRRAEKRRSNEQVQTGSSSKVTRQSLSTEQMDRKEKKFCFFCDKDKSVGTLHSASTTNVDRNIKHAASVLQDTALLSKLSAGSDVIALDVVYHTYCLANLYKKASSVKRNERKNDNERDKENRARVWLNWFLMWKILETILYPCLSCMTSKRCMRIG